VDSSSSSSSVKSSSYDLNKKNADSKSKTNNAIDRLSSASSASSYSSSTKSDNSEMSLDPLNRRAYTITKKSKSSSSSNPSDLMEHYTSMSKSYLKIITLWCTCLLIMNCVYIAFAFFDFERSSTDANSSEDTTNTNNVNWLDSVSNEKKSSCIAIGVLMHYFLLCSFCFSLCITLIQFFIVYRSFSIFNWLFLKSSLFSFGIIFLF